MNNLAESYANLDRHADALKLHEEALRLRRAKLGPDHADTAQSMNNVANCYFNLGRHADALKLREQTLALQKSTLGPDHPETLLSMFNLAESLVEMGRGVEALRLIDECLQRAEGKPVHPLLIQSAVGLRMRHFEKSKDPVGCRATAEIWEKLHRTDVDSLYSAACYRAVTAAVFRETDKSDAADRKSVAEADRAMAWLQQAVAAGYKDTAKMKKDKDLDAVRERPDFKKLVAELEAKVTREKK